MVRWMRKCPMVRSLLRGEKGAWPSLSQPSLS